MELYAAIRGLEMLKTPCKVTLYSDSQYLVRAMTEGWVIKWQRKNWWRTKNERANNIDLWEKLLPLCETHEVIFVWVKGHAGNVENERCDELSYAAIRQVNLPPDEGYENPPDEVEPIKVTEESQPCRRCETPVIKQKSRKFRYYLLCPNCHATYPIEVENPITPVQSALF